MPLTARYCVIFSIQSSLESQPPTSHICSCLGWRSDMKWDAQGTCKVNLDENQVAGVMIPCSPGPEVSTFVFSFLGLHSEGSETSWGSVGERLLLAEGGKWRPGHKAIIALFKSEDTWWCWVPQNPLACVFVFLFYGARVPMLAPSEHLPLISSRNRKLRGGICFLILSKKTRQPVAIDGILFPLGRAGTQNLPSELLGFSQDNSAIMRRSFIKSLCLALGIVFCHVWWIEP